MDFNNLEDYVRNAESNRNSAVLNSLLESEPGMKELPDTTNAKEGDVLVLDSQKKPTWGSGGGSGGGVLVCNMDTETMALDHTWQEIKDAGFAVLPIPDGNGELCILGLIGENPYSVGFLNLSMPSPLVFVAQTVDDYPVATGGNNSGDGDDGGGGNNAAGDGTAV